MNEDCFLNSLVGSLILILVCLLRVNMVYDINWDMNAGEKKLMRKAMIE